MNIEAQSWSKPFLYDSECKFTQFCMAVDVVDISYKPRICVWRVNGVKGSVINTFTYVYYACKWQMSIKLYFLLPNIILYHK